MLQMMRLAALCSLVCATAPESLQSKNRFHNAGASAHRFFRIVRTPNAVPELAALAPLHDDVHIRVVFERTLELRDVQAAAQPP